MKKVNPTMMNHSAGSNKQCDVCGGTCRQENSALWKQAFKCVNCGVKYYDRSEFNPKATADGQGGNRVDGRWAGKIAGEEDGEWP